MRMHIGVGTWFIRPFPMAAEELELSEKKKIEEAVRLLRSVTGKSGPTSSLPAPPPCRPDPSTRCLSDEGTKVTTAAKPPAPACEFLW